MGIFGGFGGAELVQYAVGVPGGRLTRALIGAVIGLVLFFVIHFANQWILTREDRSR
jgi:hypothetical protein